MQVTIRQRHEAGGPMKSRPVYYVDCRVEFSEEERAIIASRRLEKVHSLGLPPALPENAGVDSQGVSSGLLRMLSRICLFAAPVVFIIAGVKDSTPIGFLAFLLLIASPSIFIYRKSAEKRSHVASVDQIIPLGTLLNNPNFTVAARTQIEADVADTMIRESLSELKAHITSNAEGRQTEKFEI